MTQVRPLYSGNGLPHWLMAMGNKATEAKNCSANLSPYRYSHFSWPMTLNKQLPWTMVWAGFPVQLRNTSVQLVWRESVKQLSTTPLNSFNQGKSWQRPCIEIRQVKKMAKHMHVFSDRSANSLNDQNVSAQAMTRFVLSPDQCRTEEGVMHENTKYSSSPFFKV